MDRADECRRGTLHSGMRSRRSARSSAGGSTTQRRAPAGARAAGSIVDPSRGITSVPARMCIRHQQRGWENSGGKTQSRRRTCPQRTGPGRAPPMTGRHDQGIRSVEEHSSRRPMSGRAFRPSGRVAARLAAIARIEERAIGSVWGVGKVLQSPTARVDLDAGAGQVTASAAGARTGELAARPTVGAWRAAEARGVRTPVASVAHGHDVVRRVARQGHCVRECVRRASPAGGRSAGEPARRSADERELDDARSRGAEGLLLASRTESQNSSLSDRDRLDGPADGIECLDATVGQDEVRRAASADHGLTAPSLGSDQAQKVRSMSPSSAGVPSTRLVPRSIT